MGQYFRGFLYDPETGEQFMIDPKTAYKLTEHAWFANSHIIDTMLSLTSYPKRVWWVGDYAEANDFKKEIAEGINPRDVWSVKVKFDPLQYFANDCGRYLVNYTLGTFVDLQPYACGGKKDDLYHPLPILTAIGNGRGGGDYYGMNEHLAGVWAGHLIGATNDKPTGMIDFTKNCQFSDQPI